MKIRMISLLLLIAICMTVTGCQKQAESIKTPVVFYYVRAEFDHGNDNSVICGETRESADFKGNLIELLNGYLQGPQSEDLLTPFPSGTSITNYVVDNTTAILTVTDHLTQISGMDLTVACACLSKTVIELTGIESVKIQAKTKELGSNEYIYMDMNTILLLDSTEIDS